MRVLISGGSGLIGQALTRRLLAEGHSVVITSRDPSRVHPPAGVEVRPWDGQSGASLAGFLADVDAVVNLVGENLGTWPWSASRKARFVESRIRAGRALVEAFRQTEHRPRVLVQASAVGYYGASDDRILTEDSPPGRDFLAQLCVQWEASTREVEGFGVRRVVLRTGIVLAPKSTVLERLMLPYRFFMGGPLGSGKQWLPWIHMADEVGAILFLLQNDKTRGAYNLTAPNPVTNAEFGRTLARVLRRPYWLPVPAVALRLVLGEMSTLVLDGQRAVPRRLLADGYRFQYENLKEALENLLKSRSA